MEQTLAPTGTLAHPGDVIHPRRPQVIRHGRKDGRSRVLLFLLVWFLGIGAWQARERRAADEQRASVARELTSLQTRVRVAACRPAGAQAGAQVVLASDLDEPCWLTVGVKELGGPWSPSSRRVLLPARAARRVDLPRALGQRVFVFAGDLPLAHELDDPTLAQPTLVAERPLPTGAVLLADAEGRVTWSPDEPWLVVHDRALSADVAPAAPPPPGCDPALADALLSLAARPGARLRSVDPSAPLEAQTTADGPLPLLATVHLGAPRPLATPYRLQVLQPPGSRGRVGAPR